MGQDPADACRDPMSSPARRGGSSRGLLLPLLLLVIVYLVTLGLVDRRGFWVLDNAAKFIQMEAILASGFHDYSIPIPGREFDPGLNLNPIPFPFARVVEGKVYPVFSPVFAVVSSVPYRLFGMDGLYLLPFLCSILALLGVGKIVASFGQTTLQGAPDDAGDRRLSWLAMLFAGLCTPVWFYSAVFWEHAIAMCLCVWGLWFHLSFRERGGLASLGIGFGLCAMGIWFRDELYLFVLVMLALQLHGVRRSGWKPAARILGVAAAVGLAVLIPLWLFQWKSIGRPFGFHLETHVLKTSGILMHLSQRPRVLYNLLLTSHESMAVSLVSSIPLLLAFILRPRLSWSAYRRAVPALGSFAAIGTLVTLSGYFRTPGPILALDYSNSLFACAPILALGLLRLDRAPDGSVESVAVGRIRTAALLYAAFYALAAPGLGSKGIHWGNRFLLVLYPLLAIPAASNCIRWLNGLRWNEGRSERVAHRFPLQRLRRFPLPAWILVFVVVVGLAAQCFSIDLLIRVTDFSDRLNRAIEARPNVVLMTDTFWLPEFLHRAFLKREIYLVRSEETVRYFRSRLGDSGRTEYFYLTARPNPPPVEPSFIVDDRGLKFFTVRGYSQSVSPGQ